MHPDDDIPSRTQRKRAALDLQKTGERLVHLQSAELADIPLPDDVAEAIAVWHRIRSHEARRRQLQFIGALMRRIDTAPILEALDRIDGRSNAARYAFHQLEEWRERLIKDPDGLTAYLSEHPRADRQQLRHQLARIRKAPDEAKRKTAARDLFRMLRQFEAQEADSSS